jgi:phage terminase large subunit-like protein
VPKATSPIPIALRRAQRQGWRKWIKSAADERAVVEDGCYFDKETAHYVVEFFDRFLVHTLGQFAGQPFELLPWQRDDVVMPLFGWKRKDGTRRFRKCYIEVPKKNGKSTLCGGLALYLLLADGEPRAQIFGAAADREQAGIVYTEAANMVSASPELSERLQVIRSTKRIIDPLSNSFYHAISADAYTNEGLNSHAIIFDELHAQKTRDLWDALRYSMASRVQPLLISITTAGTDQESICYEQHDYTRQVLMGNLYDSSFFGYIKAAGPDDDWKDPEVWRAANPSYGITIQADQFADDFREALQSPRKESAFRRYRLNQWAGHADCWLSTGIWQLGAEPFDPAMLDKRKCYVGIDLARKRDIAAVVLLFPEPDVRRGEEVGYYVLPRFFLPTGALEERERRDHVSYSSWARQGLVTLTEGDVVDYRFIRKQVLDDAKRYKIVEIGYDPWNAELLCNQQLGEEDGLKVVEVRQTIQLMGPATAEFEKLLKDGRLRHGDHPVLRWMAGNCVVRQDQNENIMPSKKRSTARIDGIVAIIIALSRAMTAPRRRSVYETRGLLQV